MIKNYKLQIANYKKSGFGNRKSEIGNYQRRWAGFTLVELLVVMGIIAILAGISIFALQGARESGRDARRKGDLEAIRSGVELYKADCNVYPASPLPAGALTGNGSTPTCLAANRYIEDVPEDPTSAVRYAYTLTGSRYTLCAHLEDPPVPANDTSGCGSCNPSPCGYKVTSP